MKAHVGVLAVSVHMRSSHFGGCEKHGGGVQVLRNLPFLKTLPAPVFDALLARGNLVKCERGEVGARPFGVRVLGFHVQQS